MIDLSTIPVEDIRALWAAITNKTFSWDLVPRAVEVLRWATSHLKKKASDPGELLPLGSIHLPNDAAAIEALVNGDVADDIYSEDVAKGGPIAGILATVALQVLVKNISRWLLQNFDK